MSTGGVVMSSNISGLAERLRDSRRNTKLSQRDIANRIGVSYTSIGAYESGARTPSPSVLCKLALTYNVTTDYLLGIERTNINPLRADGLSSEQISVLQELIRIMKNNNKR